MPKKSNTKQNPVAVDEKRTATKKQRNIPYEPSFPAQNIVAKLDEDTWEELKELETWDGRFVLVYLLDNTEELYQDDSPEFLRGKAIRLDWGKKDYYIIDLETMQPYQNNPILHGRKYSHETWQRHKKEILQEFKELGYTDLFINEQIPTYVYVTPEQERNESSREAINSIREDKKFQEDLQTFLEE